MRRPWRRRRPSGGGGNADPSPPHPPPTWMVTAAAAAAAVATAAAGDRRLARRGSSASGSTPRWRRCSRRATNKWPTRSSSAPPPVVTTLPPPTAMGSRRRRRRRRRAPPRPTARRSPGPRAGAGAARPPPLPTPSPRPVPSRRGGWRPGTPLPPRRQNASRRRADASPQGGGRHRATRRRRRHRRRRRLGGRPGVGRRVGGGVGRPPRPRHDRGGRAAGGAAAAGAAAGGRGAGHYAGRRLSPLPAAVAAQPAAVGQGRPPRAVHLLSAAAGRDVYAAPHLSPRRGHDPPAAARNGHCAAAALVVGQRGDHGRRCRLPPRGAARTQARPHWRAARARAAGAAPRAARARQKRGLAPHHLRLDGDQGPVGGRVRAAAGAPPQHGADARAAGGAAQAGVQAADGGAGQGPRRHPAPARSVGGGGFAGAGWAAAVVWGLFGRRLGARHDDRARLFRPRLYRPPVVAAGGGWPRRGGARARCAHAPRRVDVRGGGEPRPQVGLPLLHDGGDQGGRRRRAAAAQLPPGAAGDATPRLPRLPQHLGGGGRGRVGVYGQGVLPRRGEMPAGGVPRVRAGRALAAVLQPHPVRGRGLGGGGGGGRSPRRAAWSLLVGTVRVLQACRLCLMCSSIAGVRGWVRGWRPRMLLAFLLCRPA
ncbi:hypothetical protein BU14_0256s0004 [Porphyra umbilicalis]|uniref:Uncharacterized protein n=1 Tax=Porphyra umbilicalis TaxID=2786 RepID=A0A1X6P2E8_PORUM|nr:hypothetical protein BU14_0256s0004 [Porphyra umbilicalis]|eukprot:OSX75051.1 hypothetical protein BU14_0256s0004 [Porphyra umbilicalis]